jgi:hypothetical protein
MTFAVTEPPVAVLFTCTLEEAVLKTSSNWAFEENDDEAMLVDFTAFSPSRFFM